MTEKIKITVFTDPMMGLSYESEPVRGRLEAAFAGRIAFDHVMALLVRDVADFMLPEERALGRKAGIEVYNRRLAKIYKSEESIGSLPINMDGFALFSAEHPSLLPLNLAYHAAKLAAPEKADAFLHKLRRATIVQARKTTRTEELAAVAEEAGISSERFWRSSKAMGQRRLLSGTWSAWHGSAFGGFPHIWWNTAESRC